MSVLQLFCIYVYLKYKKADKIQDIALLTSQNKTEESNSFSSSIHPNIQTTTKIISSMKEENASPRHRHSNEITCPSLKYYKEHEDDDSDDDTDDEDDNFLSQKELDFADVDERKITITPMHRIRQKGNKTIEAPQGYSKTFQGANYSPILSPFISTKENTEMLERVKKSQIRSDRVNEFAQKQIQQHIVSEQEVAKLIRRTIRTTDNFTENKPKQKGNEYFSQQTAAEEAAAKNDALISSMRWPATPIVDTELRLKHAQKMEEYEMLQFELKELASREQELKRHIENFAMRQQTYTEQKHCGILPCICQTEVKPRYRLPTVTPSQKLGTTALTESNKKPNSSAKRKKEVSYAPNRAYFLRFEKNRRIPTKTQGNGNYPQ